MCEQKSLVEHPATGKRMRDKSTKITFAILSFNQEKYIEKAIDSALNQSRAPFELIISDDASVDQTFERIEKKVATYGGNIRIRLNRNRENLGVAQHLNMVNKMASGDLIIVGAGDDISERSRVARILQCYLEMPFAHYFYSRVFQIDLDGNPLGIAESPGCGNDKSLVRLGWACYPVAIGATQAWTRVLVERFPPLHKEIWAEDQVMGFRGLLLGPLGGIKEPLVSYRIGSGVSTQLSAVSMSQRYRRKRSEISIFIQKLRDALACRCYRVALLLGLRILSLIVVLPMKIVGGECRRLLSRR